MPDDDAQAIANLCRETLDLTHLADEDRYSSLPLCVIDAVYSINANYASTTNTVKRFCQRFGLQETTPTFPPYMLDQLSITEFVAIYAQLGIEAMAESVFQNRQRTSTRGGILKAEAVLAFSRTLKRFGVDYFQDLPKVLGFAQFEEVIQQIPGQRSGLSLRYFYMLAGSDDFVKPDRMLARFVLSATGKSLDVQAIHDVVVGACTLLTQECPGLNPRLLDHAIWMYQRGH